MKRGMVGVAIACWVTWLATTSWTGSLSVLSLTPPAGESFEVALIKSAVVLISWFGAVMVAPVLMLTAVSWRLLVRPG